MLSCMTSAAPIDAYLSLLQACNKAKTASHVKQVHAHLSLHSVPLSGLLGDYLVISLAKCGVVEDAIFTSQSLPWRSVFSWTAIISACVDSRHGTHALRLYQCMQDDGVLPDAFTFVSLFKACASISDLLHGKQLHVAALWKGFAIDIFVGSALIHMYGKCGAAMEAELVFCSLSSHTVVSWSSMLSAYVQEGQGLKALCLYRQMQNEGVVLDQMASMLAIQACCSIVEHEETSLLKEPSNTEMPFDIGRALHADAKRKGFLSDAYLANSLVNLYGKCGAIGEAEHMFDAVAHRDIVSWNAMLSVYVEKGQGHKALQLYTQIRNQGASADQVTFVFAIQACASLAGNDDAVILVKGFSAKMAALQVGCMLHMDVCMNGFALDDFVGSSLIKFYGKCGAIAEAEHVFGALSQRDITSWNSMLSVYVEQAQGHDMVPAVHAGLNQAHKPLILFRQMQKEGLDLDQLAYVLALQACITLAGKDDTSIEEVRSVKIMPLEIGRALHAEALRKGFVQEAFVGNCLVNMYGKYGVIREAEHAFCSISKHTVVSWNAMISAYAEQFQAQKALQIYRHMWEEGIYPNQWTFVPVLQVCGILAAEELSLVKDPLSKVVLLDLGRALHEDALKKGYASDVFVGSTLVNMYGKYGAITEAEHVFNALSESTIVTWTALITAYVEQGEGNKGLEVYRKMLKQGVIFNHVTLISVLQACSATGSLESCKKVHFDIVSAGCDQVPSVGATLMRTYGSCVSTVDAHAFFITLENPGIVLWNACISGLAEVGNFAEVLYMFEELKAAGITPDEVTFTVVLSACSQVGLVGKGLEYFYSMSRDYGLTPDLRHYGSLLDLLGRTGDFERVEKLLSQMPMQADPHIWLGLLCACCTHGNLALAKYAYDNAVSLQPREANLYRLMSKMYADAGLLELSACKYPDI